MKFIVIALALVCGACAVPRNDGPQCHSPNGAGLNSVLIEFVSLIPSEEIAGIYWTAFSKDEQVQEVIDYLVSDEFSELFIKAHTVPEFKALNDFFCTKLYFDALYYQNKISKYLGLPVIPKPNSIQLSARAGFHGMLIDMIEVIPVNKVKKLIRQKTESDEYVKMAIDLIKSKEFDNVVKSFLSQPEYRKMIEGLKQKGFKVDEVIGFAKKYFGLI